MIRGINVSGQKSIKMADLREECAATDMANVRTYIQSGNLVFNSALRSSGKVAGVIEGLIKKRFGHSVAVLVRTVPELDTVARSNPHLKKTGVDPRHLYVTFLNDKPSKQATAELREFKSGRDELQVVEREVFGWFPDGYGRSKLNNNFIEKTLKTPATTRNWRTVLTLLDMAHGK